jgi:hypothetical protein
VYDPDAAGEVNPGEADRVNYRGTAKSGASHGGGPQM